MTKVVFRLLTFFASTLGLVVFVWLGLTVDLGERTLFGHLRAIWSSEEAEELRQGAKSKVTEVVGIEAARRAEREKAQGKASPGETGREPPEVIPAKDREGLRKVLDGKRVGSDVGKTQVKTDKKPLPSGQAKAAAPAKSAPREPTVKGRVPPPAARPSTVSGRS